ncbi:LysR family transcriptional regulator [Hoeflea sp. TYP-13]|uniref:LysR family transcriptional regulator n=1 Tax=Hoeflea sp. TYP-13 TaxID=3230023 RepID=UPI0034C6CCB0
MTDWSDLKFVLETVRQGGLSGAARVLGVNHATVSRRIAAAEQSLGALLFDRLPGGYAPTEAGLDAARAAERMEAAEAELSLLIGSRDRALSGPVTVTAPQLMIERVMAPVFAEFCQLHPEIELKVLATNEPLNLSRREADVAIRVSDAPTETLFGTRAAEQRAAVFISHDYAAMLNAEPNRPLDWIRFLHWPGLPEEIRSVWPNQRVALAVDDMAAAIGAVRAGIGATRMPCFLGDSDPQLTRLAGLSTFSYPSVWVLTHTDLRRVPRIEMFMQFVSAQLRTQQALFDGSVYIAD